MSRTFTHLNQLQLHTFSHLPWLLTTVLTFSTPHLHGMAHRGPLNKRNVIPLKFIFSEPEKYGPLVENGEQEYTGVNSMFEIVHSLIVTSIKSPRNRLDLTATVALPIEAGRQAGRRLQGALM